MNIVTVVKHIEIPHFTILSKKSNDPVNMGIAKKYLADENHEQPYMYILKVNRMTADKELESVTFQYLVINNEMRPLDREFNGMNYITSDMQKPQILISPALDGSCHYKMDIKEVFIHSQVSFLENGMWVSRRTA